MDSSLSTGRRLAVRAHRPLAGQRQHSAPIAIGADRCECMLCYICSKPINRWTSPSGQVHTCPLPPPPSRHAASAAPITHATTPSPRLLTHQGTRPHSRRIPAHRSSNPSRLAPNLASHLPIIRKCSHGCHAAPLPRCPAAPLPCCPRCPRWERPDTARATTALVRQPTLAAPCP